MAASVSAEMEPVPGKERDTGPFLAWQSSDGGSTVKSQESVDTNSSPGVEEQKGGELELPAVYSQMDISEGDRMSILHKYVLRTNRVEIMEELDLHVLHYLIEKGIITRAQDDDIRAERTRRDKVARLLDTIEGRGPRAFQGLLDGLSETQSHLATMIEEWANEASKLDEEVLRKFVLGDESSPQTPGKAELQLNIVNIHMETRVGNTLHSIDLPMSLDILTGDEEKYLLVRSRLKGLHASLCSASDGSVVLTLSFQSALHLSKFWLAYLDGTLQYLLVEALVTDEQRREHPGAKFSLNMGIDLDQYVAALRELSDGSHTDGAVMELEGQTTMKPEMSTLDEKYAEILMSINLSYLHKAKDEDLRNAQLILDDMLSSPKRGGVSEFFENRGMLLMGPPKSPSNLLHLRSLKLDCLSYMAVDFAWCLDNSMLGPLLMSTDVIEAAKGQPLSFSCVLESVKIDHFMVDEKSTLARLRELDAQSGTSEKHEDPKNIAKYLADLPTRPPSDITSETSGFVDSLIDDDIQSQSDLDMPVAQMGGINVRPGPVYDLEKSRKRGLLVIINNEKFVGKMGMPDRRGSSVDVYLLREQFVRFGFEVQIHMDVTAMYMVKTLHNVANTAAESGVGCFACAILSHGDDDVVYGSDGPVSIKELTETVTQVKGLVGKPKLFFIQASRGSMVDAGIEMGGSEMTLPSAADLLICNATPQGYYSWRNVHKGSWFVNALDKVFREYGNREDILSLMTRVANAVSKQSARTSVAEMDQKKQIPTFESSLTKTLYLNSFETSESLQSD